MFILWWKYIKNNFFVEITFTVPSIVVYTNTHIHKFIETERDTDINIDKAAGTQIDNPTIGLMNEIATLLWI